MRMSEHEVAILDLQRAPYAREACCRVVQGIRTTVDSISVGRFDQNLAVQRISPPPAAQLDVHVHTAPHRHLATNEHKGRTISSRTPSPDRSYPLRERAINMCQSHGHRREVGDHDLAASGHMMYRCDVRVCKPKFPLSA